jgi:HTH-type transcriptional regulator, global nitrogen regulator NrpRI
MPVDCLAIWHKESRHYNNLGCGAVAGVVVARGERVVMLESDARDTERKTVAILKVLSESKEPLGSISIARELENQGIHLNERTVRYHLRITDARGYTQPLGRDGRMLTRKGQEELVNALAPEQLGFVIERIASLAFQTTLNPVTRTGEVVINTSLFPKDRFGKALSAMKDAFSAGICVSELVAIAHEGEKLGDVIIPEGKTGFATICSATINGVLLKSGIPMDSRFGGILEIDDGLPRRFVAIINYAGSSLDPSLAYIKAGMTSVRQAATKGNGKILANFREIPGAAKPMAEDIIEKLKNAGIGGVVLIGYTSQPVCQIPVGLNKVGVILDGGLNPIAAAEETGIPAENIANSGTIDIRHLGSVWDL